MQERLRGQFGIRSGGFDASAAWITDAALLKAHADLAGQPSGEALDLCCGTGRVGRTLQKAGWTVLGLDLTPAMVELASDHFPVKKGPAEKIPFESGRFGLVCCRQSFQFVDVPQVLAEVKRVLAPGGKLVLSLTVPFSGADHDWLRAVHLAKQPLLKSFFTAQDLRDLLGAAGFAVEDTAVLRVRESIDRWMANAPELDQTVREKVISMVRDAPAPYREARQVAVENGEVCEDWNWVVLRAVPHGPVSG